MFRFLGGTTIRISIRRFQRIYDPNSGVHAIYDYAKERPTTHIGIGDTMRRVVYDARYIPDGSAIALKLSSFLHPAWRLATYKRNQAYEHAAFICMKDTIRMVQHTHHNHTPIPIFLDAEQDDLHEVELATYKKLIMAQHEQHQYMPNTPNPPILYKTYQMYRRDAMDELMGDMESNMNMVYGIKLVRGAYLHRDKGLRVLYDTKQAVDKNYNDAITYVLKHNNIRRHLLIATHNDESIDHALRELSTSLYRYHPQYNGDTYVAFAQLLGMNDVATKRLSKLYKVYKYVPYGGYIETLPYLSRRLYENYSIIRYMV